jgi:hypothetical protein
METKNSTRPSVEELVVESLELHSAGRTAQDEICESLECRYPLLRACARAALKVRTLSNRANAKQSF